MEATITMRTEQHDLLCASLVDSMLNPCPEGLPLSRLSHDEVEDLRRALAHGTATSTQESSVSHAHKPRFAQGMRPVDSSTSRERANCTLSTSTCPPAGSVRAAFSKSAHNLFSDRHSLYSATSLHSTSFRGERRSSAPSASPPSALSCAGLGCISTTPSSSKSSKTQEAPRRPAQTLPPAFSKSADNFFSTSLHSTSFRGERRPSAPSASPLSERSRSRSAGLGYISTTRSSRRSSKTQEAPRRPQYASSTHFYAKVVEEAVLRHNAVRRASIK